jgi:hypothetical protein
MYSKHSELFQLLAQAAQNRDLSFLEMAADYLESETNFHGNTYLAREAESYAVKLRLEEPIKGITDRYLYWFVYRVDILVCVVLQFGNKYDRKILGRNYRRFKHALKHPLSAQSKWKKNIVQLRNDLTQIFCFGS